MEVLWDQSPRTMPEITKILEPDTVWARQTVINLLKRMNEKGSISIDETGPIKKYFCKVTRAEASTTQTKKLLSNVFSGDAALLINNLVDSGEMTVDEIQELLNLIQSESKA